MLLLKRMTRNPGNWLQNLQNFSKLQWQDFQTFLKFRNLLLPSWSTIPQLNNLHLNKKWIRFIHQDEGKSWHWFYNRHRWLPKSWIVCHSNSGWDPWCEWGFFLFSVSTCLFSASYSTREITMDEFQPFYEQYMP